MNKHSVFSSLQLDAWRNLELGPEPPIASALQVPINQHVAAAEVQPLGMMNWQQLKEQIADCALCSLSSGRRQALVGLGSQKAPWMVIGEAPDENEDVIGEPFCGPSGQLLDAIFLAIGLQRERDVFLTNIVRCRPAVGREPAAAEITACKPYWVRQSELLAPSKIILLGRLAAQAVLGDSASTATLRGRVHHVSVSGRDVPVLATYHPSYLMRHPEHKNRAWQDWLLAKSI
jgi:uracil-DNA glycosylase